MKTLIKSLIVVFLSQPVFAECSNSLFTKNGLYYSPEGDPGDAWRRGRLILPEIRSARARNYTALEVSRGITYSPKGKFFLRAGAEGDDYILVLPPKNKEAVLVRSVSHSQSDVKASYVSLTRDDLDFGSCPSNPDERQYGLGQEKYFYDTNQFVLAHSNERELSRTPLLDKQFHFIFEGVNGCYHTGRLLNDQKQWVSGSVYTGHDRVVINPKGQFLIEQTVFDVAQILLPPPAFASLPSPKSSKPDTVATTIVSSVEASLHALHAGTGVCLELSAPIPTGDYSKRWFSGARADKRAAMRAANRGEWTPVVTEFHFQQIEKRNQSAFVRLYWRR